MPFGGVGASGSPSDSRSRSLRLTAPGKRHYERLAALAAQAERSFVGEALSAEECRQLLALLDRLQSNSGRAAAAF